MPRFIKQKSRVIFPLKRNILEIFSDKMEVRHTSEKGAPQIWNKGRTIIIKISTVEGRAP
jgi:hypothetical protein